MNFEIIGSLLPLGLRRGRTGLNTHCTRFVLGRLSNLNSIGYWRIFALEKKIRQFYQLGFALRDAVALKHLGTCYYSIIICKYSFMKRLSTGRINKLCDVCHNKIL